MHRRIYLDNSATTPMLPEVAEVMDRCYRESVGNPASSHWAGREARRTLENARETIAELLGARLAGPDPDKLIFTSGGTEANNLAIRGVMGLPPGHLIISAIEHPSVEAVAAHLEQQGSAVDRLGVSRQGVVQARELPRIAAARTRLVSVMLANNETGVIQPIAELAATCRAAGIPLHTDAVQAVGSIPVMFRELGADLLSFSAHKFHGPPGIGGLLVRGSVPLQRVSFGGAQQLGLRPGTEPVALCVGMAHALALWHQRQAQIEAHLRRLRDRFESALQQAWPAIVLHGVAAPRLPQTSNISFPQLDRQLLLLAIDRAGVACSSGSACASGSAEPSRVLRAMGCSRTLVQGALRFSFSRLHTDQDVTESIRRILLVCKDLWSRTGKPKMPHVPPSLTQMPL